MLLLNIASSSMGKKSWHKCSNMICLKSYYPSFLIISYFEERLLTFEVLYNELINIIDLLLIVYNSLLVSIVPDSSCVVAIVSIICISFNLIDATWVWINSAVLIFFFLKFKYCGCNFTSFAFSTRTLLDRSWN